MTVLALEGIRKSFGETSVLRGVDPGGASPVDAMKGELKGS